MYLATHALPYAVLQPLSPASIQPDKGFWHTLQELNRSTTIPHGYQMLEKSGTLDNLRLAAQARSVPQERAGEFRGYVFQDSDVYKWLEAAALAPGQTPPDASTVANLHTLVALLADAQFPDGYLNSYFTLVKPNQQWTDLEWAHEMYCAGHLIEAGIAHKRATGETALFNIARRFADHIDATFGTADGKRPGFCGHPEIELALVELYRETGEARYLKLAQFFIDQRGHQTFQGLRHIGPLYMQDRVPVRQAQVVEGHAVRQLYLCAGVTDLYLETGEPALREAMTRLWQDMTRGKLYLTGGVGARGYGEMFGDAYELPSKEAYCETCAAIAGMMWHWRMLLATHDVCYADALEQTLYNGFLSGIALDGKHFFYENPLRSDGEIVRQEWFACACCPPNVMRALALIEQYCATTNARGLQIHQYMNVRLRGERTGDWRLETGYPWDGNVRLVCETAGAGELALRVPGWCAQAQLQVNGEGETVAGGTYARVQRQWKQGDTVELQLPMTPSFVRSHPYVDATRGSVALRRGPLIYCIEQQDQTADIANLQIDPTQPVQPKWEPAVCGGIITLHAGGAVNSTTDWQDTLYRPADTAHPSPQPTELTAVPYFAWGNRTPGKMRVWVPTME